jgi:competence protein ComEA
MKWITDSLQRILGFSDSSNFFEHKAHQIRVRVKVAAGAALLCGIGVVVVSIITSAAMSSSTEVVVPDELQATTAVQIPPEHSGLGAVLVHVVGEVVTPGMYELPRQSRLIDAVMAAGGLTGNAGECGVNLARFVNDGEQIKIPTREEGCSGQVGSPTGNLVSLNQATSEQIDSLPGIGPTLAERIVQWREKNGGFTSIEQLNEVSGIGDKLYAGLKDLVTL